MNIRPIGFLDTSAATANLIVRHKASWDAAKLRAEYAGSPHHATRSILLRGPANPSPANWFDDVPQVEYAILKDFKSARSLLLKIANLVAPMNGGQPGELGKAMIVSLPPGGWVDWHVDEGAYAEAHHRFHVCLVPSPGAMLYVGGEAVNLPVGMLNYVNNRVPHSAYNVGPVSRIHLIADIRRPDAPTD